MNVRQRNHYNLLLCIFGISSIPLYSFIMLLDLPFTIVGKPLFNPEWLLDYPRNLIPVIESSSYNVALIIDIIDASITKALMPIGDKIRYFRITNRLRQMMEPDYDMRVLDLSELGLGEEHVPQLQVLADFLKNNNTVKELRLNNNNLDDVAIAIFADLLRHNHSLQKVNLANNAFSKEAWQSIAEALKENKGLVELNLSNNSVDNDSLQTLFNALTNNYTLQKLNLACCSYYPNTELPSDSKLHLKSLLYFREIPLEWLRNNPSITEIDERNILYNLYEERENNVSKQRRMLIEEHRALQAKSDDIVKHALTFATHYLLK